MITLHQLPPLDRAPSLSPFCLKVETYLRMTEVTFESVRGIDVATAPKGKLPYIVDDGARIADSYFIIEHLRRTRGDALDAALAPRDLATAHAFTRMLDEHLYWALVHSRWFDDRFSPRMIAIFFGEIAGEQLAATTAAVRDAMSKTLHAHGIGRHSPDEIVARAKADLDAVAILLGDRPFMLGDKPTTLDAATFAFVANVLDVDMDTALRRHLASHANLVAYSRRIRDRYFA
jgi:glutathione S-transferase